MVKDYKEAQKFVGFHQYNDGSRPTGDFYATPPEAILPLLEKEKFGKQILEPCCGNGAISKILIDAGYDVISDDLFDWGYGNSGIDFLKADVTPVDAVITNPPFKYGVEFLLKALDCTKKKNGKVAFLARLQWLEGQKRRKIFENYPLYKVWVFSKRIPRMHRFDFNGKPGTSLLAFAWFVFDWKYEGEPQIGWLP